MNLLRSVMIGLSLLAAPVLLLKVNAETFPQNVPISPLTDSFVTTTLPTVGEALSDWAQSPPILASNPDGTGIWGDTYFRSIVTPVAGSFYYEGENTYSIYPTLRQGIGYVLQVQSNGLSGDQGFKPITGTDEIHLYHGGPKAPIYYTYRIKYVTTGQTVLPGVSSIGGDVIGISRLQSSFNQTPSNVAFLTATVNITNKGCTFDSANMSIALAPASLNQFKGVGTAIPTTDAFTINLNCDDNTAVKGVLSDVLSPNNTTDTLTISNTLEPGVDMGVGIQLFYSTSTGQSSPSAIKFGPDASWDGAENQFTIKSVTDPNNVVLTLTPQYFQNKPTVESGEFIAKTTLTLSYE